MRRNSNREIAAALMVIANKIVTMPEGSVEIEQNLEMPPPNAGVLLGLSARCRKEVITITLRNPDV